MSKDNEKNKLIIQKDNWRTKLKRGLFIFYRH